MGGAVSGMCEKKRHDVIMLSVFTIGTDRLGLLG